MGIVGFLNATRSTTINGGQLNFSSISIMFTAFLPMFIGSYISRFTNEKIGFLLAALCMSMLNSTFAVFSNEVNASMQAIINAVLLVVFLIYLSNEHLLVSLFNGNENRKQEGMNMINLTKNPFFLQGKTLNGLKIQKVNDIRRKNRSVVCPNRVFRRSAISGTCHARTSHWWNYVSLW